MKRTSEAAPPGVIPGSAPVTHSSAMPHSTLRIARWRGFYKKVKRFRPALRSGKRSVAWLSSCTVALCTRPAYRAV